MVSERRCEAPAGGFWLGAPRPPAPSAATWARRRRGIGIETEFVVPDPDHVGPREPPRLPHPLAVHVGPVHTDVEEDVPLWIRPDLRMLARHVMPRDDDIGPGVPAELERAFPHGVLPAIGETNQPAPGLGRGLGRDRRRHQIGKGAGVEELGAAGPGGIHHEQLMRPDRDLVAMEERRRLGPQADTIHQDLRPCGGRPDCHGPQGGSLENRMPGLHSLAPQHHPAVRGRPYDCFTGGDDMPLAVDFEMDHRLIPRKIEWRNVSVDL